MRRDVFLALMIGVAATALPADQPPVVSGGVRAGPLMGRTDLTDSVSGFGEVFLRGRTTAYADFEANAGYSRLTGDGFATGIGQLGWRLVRKPAVTGLWQPLVYGGIGLMRQDIDEFSPRSTFGAESIAWSASLPLGVGFRRILSPRLALEILGNYTYTLKDDLDSAAHNKGNDMLFSLGVGPGLGRVRAPVPRAFPSPSPTGEPVQPSGTTPVKAGVVDRDGDGLTDEAETRQWFTNPLMADSDLDGLTDGEEVHTHGSNPNRADSDGDGTFDGAEVAIGQDPLVADESEPEPSLPAVAATFEFASISFASGGAELTAEAQALLDRVAQHLRQTPTLEIEIRGFTDSLGDRRDNLRLSGRRCGVVRDYLVRFGIEDWRLTLEAFGEDEPVASNSTREGRRMNRRAELAPLSHPHSDDAIR